MSGAFAPMQASDLLDELQHSLTHGSVAKRVDLLKRVTDLFLHGATQFKEDHISVFDDVFECLVAHMHDEAQIMLSNRLAQVPAAPRRLIRHLALHDRIEVAAPVLAHSERIDDATLIEAARGKSQGHLLAIAARTALSGQVTEVLVERGNDDVVRAVAGNPRAELTTRGFETLIDRADQSEWIATCIAMRPNMPREYYVRLVAKASETVRRKLEASFPNDADAINNSILAVAERARTAPTSFSEQARISHRMVQLLFKDGRLNDQQVRQFAEAGQFDEVSASLAAIAKIPIPMAEAIIIDAQDEGLLILCKVCGLSWPTVREIILLHAKQGRRAHADPDAGRESYARLRTATAHQVLRFHRMQLSAISA